MSRFKGISDLYEGDLPSPKCLESELHSWKMKWRKELEDNGESSLPTTLMQTLRHVSSMYPNITAIAKILAHFQSPPALLRGPSVVSRGVRLPFNLQ